MGTEEVVLKIYLWVTLLRFSKIYHQLREVWNLDIFVEEPLNIGSNVH